MSKILTIIKKPNQKSSSITRIKKGSCCGGRKKI